MEVQSTPDQKAFIRQAIESGRFSRAEDAVEEALALWEERERKRAEILAAVDVAEASHARGEGRVLSRESVQELADKVKQRGRARLAAEPQTPHEWRTVSPRKSNQNSMTFGIASREKSAASRLPTALLIP